MTNMLLFSTLILFLAAANFPFISGDNQQGTLHRRSYLYVGQSYVTQGNSTVAHAQMYVERLTPAKVTQPFPILFIHGQGMTGTNLLNTPDGRLGWADHLLGKGYELYIVDQPARGRSPWQSGIDGDTSPFDTATVEGRFTATERYKLWPQAILHTRWPGNGSVGDPTFDKFYASTVPSLISFAEEGQKIQNAGAQLLDQIGPVIVMTHSQGGQFGWILGDARPKQVKAIVALEPNGPPFIQAIFPPFIPARIYGLTDIPLAYSPPIAAASDIARVIVSETPGFTCFQQAKPPRQLINLVDIPVLVVTSQSGYHTIYDGCSVDYLRQAGVSVKHVHLADVGIDGNGHMFFMEENNIEIADKVILPWITRIKS
ncbi:Alpha/Beta hydrolase protein [Mycena rebaudengoi]|nr:Alpha/Beta hydrolase protein [Mycena rebaudengoi]